MCRGAWAVALLGVAAWLGVLPAWGDEPTSLEGRAHEVARLFAASDEAALKRLAADDALDPWRLAEVLCRERAFDAAHAFAGGASRPDTAALDAWVRARSRGETETERRILEALAAADAAVGGRKAAEALRALAPALEAGDDYLRARALDLATYAHSYGGRPTEALAAAKEAAERAERAGWLRGAAACLNNVAQLELAAGDPAAARDAWLRELAVNERRRHPVAIARTQANLGLLEMERGAFVSAVDLLASAQEAFGKLGATALRARALEGLGLAQWKIGRYADALASHEQALAIFEATGDGLSAALNRGYLGVIHSLLGAFDRAEKALKTALEALDPNRHAAYFAQTNGNLAIVYLLTDRLEEARDRLLQTRAIFVRLKATQQLAPVDTDLGRTCFLRREYVEAETYYKRAQAAYTEADDLLGVAAVWKNLGDLYAERGREHWPEAQAAYEQAVRYARELGLATLELRSLKNLTHLHLRAGRFPEALARGREAVERSRDVLVGLGSHHGAVARENIRELYRDGALAALRSDRAADAYYFLESGRGGVLLESLGARERARGFVLPEALRRDEAKARAETAEAGLRLLEARKRGDLTQSRVGRKAFEAAQGRLLEVVGRIERQEKAVAQLIYPSVDSLEDVQARLLPTDALVLTGVYDEEGLGVVVTQREARVVALPEIRAVRKLSTSIDPNEPGSFDQQTIARLRKLVVAPLKLDKSVKRVFFSPSRDLFQLPLGLLLEPRTVVYVPSATIHGILAARSAPRGKDVIALGGVDYSAYRRLGPLPGSEQEARAVGDLVLIGEEATEAGFLTSLASQPHWAGVLVACHGVFESTGPFDAYLALTPGATATAGDGRLTALELLRARLHADVVVLSACGSGRGVVVEGEGLLGLLRAVMLAGAPRVIVNLWNADDKATLVFTKAFFRIRKEPGRSTAEALRRAQAEVRKNEKWRDPYFWAGWTLWGVGD